MLRFLKILWETLPIFIGLFFAYLFWEYNVLLFITFIILSFLFIYSHDDKVEWWFWLYGIIIGLIVELLGSQIGYESFANPDLAAIPIWLPFAWGYGFVAIKRIGFLFKNSKPKKQTKITKETGINQQTEL